MSATDVIEEMLAHKIEGKHVEEDVADVLMRKSTRKNCPDSPILQVVDAVGEILIHPNECRGVFLHFGATRGSLPETEHSAIDTNDSPEDVVCWDFI